MICLDDFSKGFDDLLAYGWKLSRPKFQVETSESHIGVDPLKLGFRHFPSFAHSGLSSLQPSVGGQVAWIYHLNHYHHQLRSAHG